jgi:hypothetical protein
MTEICINIPTWILYTAIILLFMLVLLVVIMILDYKENKTIGHRFEK